MGFYVTIELKLHICETTGKPFYYSKKENKRIYDIASILIPEEFRKSVQLRGSYLHAYTDVFEQDDNSEVEVSEFLEFFPKWKEVKAYSSYDDTWNFEDHKNFKEFLKWCKTQDVCFYVSWC